VTISALLTPSASSIRTTDFVLPSEMSIASTTISCCWRTFIASAERSALRRALAGRRYE